MINLETTLATLLNEDEVTVQQYAAFAASLKRGFETGKLTQSQFAELKEDLSRLRAVMDNASRVRLEVQLNMVLEGLIELAKIAKPV